MCEEMKKRSGEGTHHDRSKPAACHGCAHQGHAQADLECPRVVQQVQVVGRKCGHRRVKAARQEECPTATQQIKESDDEGDSACRHRPASAPCSRSSITCCLRCSMKAFDSGCRPR